MKLIVVHEPLWEAWPYRVYETEADGKRVPLAGYPTEDAARAYCEARQKTRTVAEYTLDG